ncbi:MAG: Gfo/Idh/MocA family oxidoreductase [Clostridia bacterium]|nr:Gfo/Idh/MocA family oxidoreductase [Clostridia bacterium]
MEQVKFGIIGCGNISQCHIGNFEEGKIKDGVMVAICDINPDKIEATKKRYGDKFEVFTDAREMLNSGKIDAVLICTPHYLHPELAIAAMDAGVHCIVEKPAGVYTLQVKEMLERAKTAKTKLSMMFNQRTNPAFKKMREMVATGKIGDVKRTNWIITNWYRTQEYYDSGSWRATWSGEGGGVLYNQSPHQLDLFQWIVGMMPSKVHAFCHFGKWHNIEVEDDVTCYVEYPNGATGVFITTTADAPGTNRFEITGTKGTLLFENDKLYFTELEIDEREHCFATNLSFATPEKKETVEVPLEGENSQHAGVCQNFVDAILGRDTLFAPVADGLNGVILANSMLLSTWLGKTISLPFDDDLYYEELKKRIAVSKPHPVKDKPANYGA